MLHKAFIRSDHDPVADLDRAFDQQDQAGYEVIDDILQAKPDTNGQGPRYQRNIRQIHARHRHGHTGCENETQIADPGGNGIAQAFFDFRFRQDLFCQISIQRAHQCQAHDENNDGKQNVSDGDFDAADLQSPQDRARPAQ